MALMHLCRAMTYPISGRAMTKAKQQIVLWGVARLAVFLVIEFVLLRIVGPRLVNLHNDGALVLAVLIYAAALAALVWLVIQFWSFRARLAEVDTRFD